MKPAAGVQTSITSATTEDAAAISALILPVVNEFVCHEYSPAGKAKMLQSMQTESISRYIDEGVRYWLAVAAGEPQPIGVLALRDQDYLYHLFVAKQFHCHGVGKLLWQHLLGQTDASTIQVNSSRFAVEFYQRLGFVAEGDSVDHAGIVCYPMHFTR